MLELAVRWRRRWKTCVSGLVGCASLGGAQTAAAIQPPVADIVGLLDVTTIGDWVLGCDNQGGCTMIGHADLADPNHIVANSTRSMAIRIQFGPPYRPSTAITLLPDGRRIGRVQDGVDWAGAFVIPTGGDGISIGYHRRDLTQAEAEALLRRLQAGTPFVAANAMGARSELSFPAVGFAEARRDVARRQREIAAWRRQARPDDGPVRLVAVTPAIVSGVPAVTAAQMDWCPAGVDARNLSLYDLGQRRRLWRHVCPIEGDNPRSRWFMQDGQSETARPLAFPRDFGGTTADTRWALPNATFDWDFGVLRSYLFWSAEEDCGRTMVWGWTGERFVLLERRVMPVCNGLDHGEWAVTYRRTVVAREDHGE